jgi:hypothetical protein
MPDQTIDAQYHYKFFRGRSLQEILNYQLSYQAMKLLKTTAYMYLTPVIKAAIEVLIFSPFDNYQINWNNAFFQATFHNRVH